MTKKSKAIAQDILITGDLVIDHNIYLGDRKAPGSKKSQGTNIVKSYGGAGLLFNIVDEMINAKKDLSPAPSVQFGFEIQNFKTVGQRILKKCHHSFSAWRPVPEKGGSEKFVWRMTQPFGYSGNDITFSKNTLPKSEENENGYKVVVIDDGALGFRNNKELWPDFITKEKQISPEWIVYKMSSPIIQGDLFRAINKKYKDKLIIVLSINDLRIEEVSVSKRLSWERTALDVLTSLKGNAKVHKLLECKHLIINFGSEGALWVNNQKKRPENKLIFDPGYMEREWDQSFEGSAFGFMSCLTASLINQLTAAEYTDSHISQGISSGLSAMRCLNIKGHGEFDSSCAPEFPFKEVIKHLLTETKNFSVADLPSLEKIGHETFKHWTFMNGSAGSHMPLYGLARRVALFGPESLTNIPYSRFGKLFSVDRKELESLRGIKGLISQYEAQKQPKKPLSIAVFGPPGSGKSFGIKQITKSVMGIGDDDILEFNLSQFTDSKELTAAFHMVRDRVLKGKTPCVFWDEFDSDNYSWLQYLLAPMQDGEFREGQLVHPIGKCVFVFAGGTSFDMENFGPSEKNKDDYKNFKNLKGPDFVSRLNGYLNVLGPNKKLVFDKESEKWIPDDNPKDICFPVRRALLMRGMLGYGGKNENKKLKIDSGLLTALIEIDEYKHGARSLETILTLSKRQDASVLRRSDLPPREQISLHVDYDKFLELINRDLPYIMDQEKIAPAVHSFYRQLGHKEDWIKYKPEMDMDYDDLKDEFIKESNIAAAARIPEVLSMVGLKIKYGSPSDKLSEEQYNKILNNNRNLELLAEAEHDGWMECLIRNEKENKLLIPYSKLPEEEKEKDRNSVRSYFPILEEAGYCIIQNK